MTQYVDLNDDDDREMKEKNPIPMNKINGEMNKFRQLKKEKKKKKIEILPI